MTNGTAGGVDSLTVEILKADLETSVDVLNITSCIMCGRKSKYRRTGSGD